MRASLRYDPIDLVAATFAFLLLAGFSSAFNAPFWSLRSAILLIAGAIGLPLLVTLARRPVVEARLALGFLGIATLATLAARHPVLALVGNYGLAPGLLFIGALLAMWSIGRFVSEEGRRLVVTALLAGLLLNVVVALGQRTLDMRWLYLSGYRGSHGLLGNPVQLGALLAGGIPLLAERLASNARVWVIPMIATGVALQFSGSRIGLVAAIGLVVGLSWHLPRPVVAAAGGLLAVGFVLGSLSIPYLPDSGRDQTTVIDKIEGATTRHVTDRAETWWKSLGAMRERPVLGYGPGRYVEASSPSRTADLAQGDPETLFFDSHNVFVEYLVDTGPLGGMLFLAFVAISLARARGVLALAFVGIVVVQLVEPQSPATTPIALLALGMAAQAPVAELGRSMGRLVATATLAVGATVGALVLLVGDFRLKQADLDFSVAQAESAVALLPPWPTPMSKLGQIHIYQAKLHRDDRSIADPAYERAMVSFERAARRDPELAAHWNNLGNVALSENDYDRAGPAFRMALEKNPWSASAMVGLAYVVRQEGDEAKAVRLLRRARLVATDPGRIDTILDAIGTE